jgi:hypothetical protein
MIDFKKAFQSVFIFLGVFGAAVFLFSAITVDPRGARLLRTGEFQRTGRSRQARGG